jgi:hypothetical protein
LTCVAIFTGHLHRTQSVKIMWLGKWLVGLQLCEDGVNLIGDSDAVVVEEECDNMDEDFDLSCFARVDLIRVIVFGVPVLKSPFDINHDPVFLACEGWWDEKSDKVEPA